MRLDSVVIACLLSFTVACKPGDDGKSDSGVTETVDPSTDSADTGTDAGTDTGTDTDTDTDTGTGTGTGTDTDTDTGTDTDAYGDGVTAGELDFGSGGGSSGVTTHSLTVTNDIIAHPFTVIEGAYYGSVGIYPTSTPYPTDGTEVRMWWSETAGGPPLAGVDCAPSIGREANNTWDQSETRGYGCQIDNVDSTLFLNMRACVSTFDDTTCTAVDAEAGSPVHIYVGGRLNDLSATDK
jgi:hypothetical protein